MESNRYPHADRDLLAEPEYYMYSAFAGASFLSAYAAQRQQAIENLEERYLARMAESAPAKVEQLWVTWQLLLHVAKGLLPERIVTLHRSQNASTETRGQAIDAISALSACETIVTQDALRWLCVAVTDTESWGEPAVYEWVSWFLKRFEVTKKLYGSYTRDLTPATDQFQDLMNYALLSLVLALHFDRSSNLKMLNGVLKLNDVLCSTSDRLEGSEELLATLCSLRIESIAVRELARSKGVSA